MDSRDYVRIEEVRLQFSKMNPLFLMHAANSGKELVRFMDDCRGCGTRSEGDRGFGPSGRPRNIKGNVSFPADERIYHVAGSWFCSQQEAHAPGWRKSLK